MHARRSGILLALVLSLGLITMLFQWTQPTATKHAPLATGSEIEVQKGLDDPETRLARTPEVAQPDSQTPPHEEVGPGTAPAPRPEAHGPGLLWDARKCLADPYYNPSAKRLKGNDVRELQRLIDTLNADLASIRERKEGEYRNIAEQKIAAGQTISDKDLQLVRQQSQVLLVRDQVGNIDGHEFRNQVVVVLGENAEADALYSLFNEQMRISQETVRDAIASMQ